MRLLVVEDDARLAEVLRQGLGEQGFTVDVARDGRASLTMALESDYDAILLDAMLPGKSGFDVLRELRERGRKTPILMLTARASVEDRVQGLDLGADDYLPKPFDFSELLARVRAITRRPPDRSALRSEADSHHSRNQLPPASARVIGRLQSVRMRLTAWYAATLALVLSVFSALLYGVVVYQASKPLCGSSA